MNKRDENELGIENVDSNLDVSSKKHKSYSTEKKLVADGKILGCLQCGVCEFKTDMPLFMTSHMRKHTRKKNVICEKCFQRFSKGVDLVNHIRKAHRKVEYMCKVCDFRTSAQTTLRKHCFKHENVKLTEITIDRTFKEESKHKCQICCYQFDNMKSLKIHMRMHGGCFKFVCEICRNQFQKSDDMKRISNTDSGLFQFLCKCDYKYTLKNPIRGKLILSEGQRPFHCGICSCTFRNQYVLTAHMKSHLEKRNAYKCQQCTSSFRLMSHLESHMKSHENVKN